MTKKSPFLFNEGFERVNKRRMVTACNNSILQLFSLGSPKCHNYIIEYVFILFSLLVNRTYYHVYIYIYI